MELSTSTLVAVCICHLSSEESGYIFILNVRKKISREGKKLYWNSNEEVVVVHDILFLDG